MNVQSTCDGAILGDQGTRQPEEGRRDPQPDARQGLLAGGPGSGGTGGRQRFACAFRDESRTAIVLGGGPSATDFRTEWFDRYPVIVVNNGWELYRKAEALWAADRAWWALHAGSVRGQFEGRCFGSDARQCAALGIEHRIVEFDIALSRNWEHLGSGGRPGNSGAQAINLAFLAGARRILLVGFDMQPRDGKNHWFGEHPKGVVRDTPYRRFIAGMSAMASELFVEGIQVINCSPKSALPFWPRVTGEQAMALCARS